MKTFETDILKLRADKLNFTLCMFVKEVKKPNGDPYAPDSIFYLTLGIQVGSLHPWSCYQIIQGDPLGQQQGWAEQFDLNIRNIPFCYHYFCFLLSNRQTSQINA